MTDKFHQLKKLFLQNYKIFENFDIFSGKISQKIVFDAINNPPFIQNMLTACLDLLPSNIQKNLSLHHVGKKDYYPYTSYSTLAFLGDFLDPKGQSSLEYVSKEEGRKAPCHYIQVLSVYPEEFEVLCGQIPTDSECSKNLTFRELMHEFFIIVPDSSTKRQPGEDLHSSLCFYDIWFVFLRHLATRYGKKN